MILYYKYIALLASYAKFFYGCGRLMLWGPFWWVEYNFAILTAVTFAKLFETSIIVEKIFGECEVHRIPNNSDLEKNDFNLYVCVIQKEGCNICKEQRYAYLAISAAVLFFRVDNFNE